MKATRLLWPEESRPGAAQKRRSKRSACAGRPGRSSSHTFSVERDLGRNWRRHDGQEGGHEEGPEEFQHAPNRPLPLRGFCFFGGWIFASPRNLVTGNNPGLSRKVDELFFPFVWPTTANRGFCLFFLAFSFNHISTKKKNKNKTKQRTKQRIRKKTMCRAISSGIVQIASIILLLSGVVVAVVGIIGYVELQKLSTFGIPALNFPIILMGIGLVICIIAVLMCCAARKQIRWLLFLIFVLLLCFFIGQAVMVGLVFGATQNANKLLTKGWNGLSASGQQLIENEFNCCGWTNQTGCNPQSANDQSFGRLAADESQSQPTCNSVITDYFQKYLDQIAITAAVVLAVEAVVGVALCCLITSKKHHHQYEYETMHE